MIQKWMLWTGLCLAAAAPAGAVELGANERLITVLQTNDIHGHVEPSKQKDGTLAGGMALWAGVTRSIRAGLARQHGERAGVLLLDGGDQFQGTLVSNHDEGRVVFETMNLAGYDAVVPGNHDYDFGPVGWLDDRVTPENPDKDPRGALKRLVALARFPLVSSNVYYKASLVDRQGRALNPDAPGFNPSRVDWARASRPDFLQPYLVKEVAGVRVAVIGMDHPRTPVMTTVENVSDLYFRNEADTYREIRAGLAGRADVFVLLYHGGNAMTENSANELVERLTAQGNSGPGGGHVIDVLAGGHTHFLNNAVVNGVPVVQSLTGGDRFGRVDLVYDTAARSVRVQGAAAGVTLHFDRCAPSAASFCEARAGGVAYEGEIARPDPEAERLIAEERARVAVIADRVLGSADAEVWRDRIAESPLSNSVTDAMRRSSGAELAFVNTGGLRAPLPAGTIRYEDLYEVLPFNNRGVVVGPMQTPLLIGLIERSIHTCGSFGSLMQSGLKVSFDRDCARAVDGVDPGAKLTLVETESGEVIFDRARGGITDPSRTFEVVTFDFLADGGSGYGDFGKVPRRRTLGIVREEITETLLREPARFPHETDGRWTATPARR